MLVSFSGGCMRRVSHDSEQGEWALFWHPTSLLPSHKRVHCTSSVNLPAGCGQAHWVLPLDGSRDSSLSKAGVSLSSAGSASFSALAAGAWKIL